MDKIAINGLSQQLHMEENRQGKAYHFQLTKVPTDEWITLFNSFVERNNDQYGRQSPQLNVEIAKEGPWLTLRDTTSTAIKEKLWSRLLKMMEAANDVIESNEAKAKHEAQAVQSHLEELAKNLGIPMVKGEPVDFAAGIKP